MKTQVEESELVARAVAYLKRQYGEDTVSMKVTRNTVVDGRGVLEVECTVSLDGQHSDWSKWFTFSAGEVASMRWEMH